MKEHSIGLELAIMFQGVTQGIHKALLRLILTAFKASWVFDEFQHLARGHLLDNVNLIVWRLHGLGLAVAVWHF
jgi:hypothetical protein